MKKMRFDLLKYKFSWMSLGGAETFLYKQEGNDIIIDQDNMVYNPYFNCGHELFASILRYFKEIDLFPEIEKIQGELKLSTRSQRHNINNLINTYIQNEMSYYEDGEIFLNLSNNGRIGIDIKDNHFFYSYRDNEIFKIGKEAKTGISAVFKEDNIITPFCNIEEIIRFDSDDALNVLRGIFFLSHDTKDLVRLYSAAMKYSKDA